MPDGESITATGQKKMGVRGQTIWGKDVERWRAINGYGFPPSWPTVETAEAWKSALNEAAADEAVRLLANLEALENQIKVARQHYGTFVAAWFSEAVSSESFPHGWQRENYPNHWAVLTPGGGAIAFRASKEEAEAAARQLYDLPKGTGD